LIAIATNSSLRSRIDGRYKTTESRLYQGRSIVEQALDVIDLQPHSQQILRTLEDRLVSSMIATLASGRITPRDQQESRRPGRTVQSAQDHIRV
jgi:hypothetical protein